MRYLFDVFRNHRRRHGDGGPKAICTVLGPDDFVVQWHPTGLALLANVTAFRRGELEALQMEGRWAGFAANETPALTAQEAPVDVNRTLFQSVLWADHRRVRQNFRPSRNAFGIRVVRRGTFDAPDQLAFGGGRIRAGIVRDARMTGMSRTEQRARLAGSSGELVLRE